MDQITIDFKIKQFNPNPIKGQTYIVDCVPRVYAGTDSVFDMFDDMSRKFPTLINYQYMNGYMNNPFGYVPPTYKIDPKLAATLVALNVAGQIGKITGLANGFIPPGLDAPVQAIKGVISTFTNQIPGLSAAAGAVGVIAIEMSAKDEELFIVNVEMHPNSSGNWTIDGSVTSQYEQHLRAILDLPLGDPAMSAQFVVTGNFYCGEKPDMYRPYLHLMARTPALKFHQYKNSSAPGELMGHITVAGNDLAKLIEEIEHALEYMQGEIDE